MSRGAIERHNMSTNMKSRSLFDGPIVRRAAADAFGKLSPRTQVRNPVMFVVFVEIGRAHV